MGEMVHKTRHMVHLWCLDTTSGRQDTTPLDTTSGRLDTTPLDTTSGRQDTTPLDMTSGRQDTTPLDTTSRPLDTTSGRLDTTNGRQDTTSPACADSTRGTYGVLQSHKLLYLGKGNTEFSFTSCICESYNSTCTNLFPYSESTVARGRPDVYSTLGPL